MNHSLKIILVILFLISAFIARIKLQKPPETLPKNQKITFAATLKAEPKISDKYQILSIADSKIYAGLYPVYAVGDRLQISGKIDEKGPPGARLAEGGKMFYPKVEKIGAERSALGFLQSFRAKISQNMARLLPSREAALLQGTVLGVDNIQKDFKDQLIATGTIHVVVVSGQNMAIVAGIFMAFSKYIGRRRALLLACGAVILYGALAGFSAPVMRATIMVLASTAAVYFGREVWPVWSLLIAALIILFISPSAIGEVSFQLTFAASLGIMTLGRYLTGLVAGPVESFLPVGAHSDHRSNLMGKDNPELRAAGNPSTLATRNILLALASNAAVATSAYLFTAPIIFLNFGRISLSAPLVNVLVAEAVFPIMVLGFVTAIASLIFMPLAQVLAYFAYVPAFYFVKVVEAFANF